MDDAIFQSSIAPLGVQSDSAMELDYMDELLLEGCWLETSDGSSFFHQSSFFDSSYLWPTLEAINEKPSINPLNKFTQEGTQATDLGENSALINRSNGQNSFEDGSELNKLFWIGPRANQSTAPVMERLIKALNYLKESAKSRDSLIQIWVPVNKGGTRVLTTIDQPYSINSSSQQLASYRNISINYVFAAEEDCSGVCVGLPGRVFMGKVPEWSPDVRFFRVDEYPRVSYAQQCDVRGTLALPVFEQGSRNCLGVIEVVMTTQKVNYRPELENVCRALEAVDLHCSEFSSPQIPKDCISSSYQAALPEILEVIKSTCASHRLPLAQMWVPCIQQGGKDGCRHSDENLPRCVSTVDLACFVADPCMQGFHEACSEHHLFKGQGVAGKAFLTNQPCFSTDITTYSKTEYPLSHHARIFGLCAAVAIRLRCIYTGHADFVLEFFLPIGCRDPEEQKKVLTSLSIIIQRVCRSLRVVTDKELCVENTRLVYSKEESCGTAIQERNGIVPVPPGEKPREEVLGGKDCNLKGSPLCSIDYSTVGEASFANSGKSGEKKRTKTEKTITLEVLCQHFAGSLKDAAKSIGVCPTTLKRICRQHGIKRWPSRKIKKVGHSLQKLQVVIDSVQGASGAFQIGSFYSNFPDLASPNLSVTTSPFSASKQSDPPQRPSQDQLEGAPVSPQTATSKSPSSSSSQTSSSSQCCSTGTHQDHPLGGVNSHEWVLKRVRSEALIHAPIEEPTKPISRSQSQKSLLEHLNNNNNNNNNVDNNRPPLPKCGEGGNSWRVKVSYGEEKIRFRIPKNCGFKDLVQEVVRRFNIGDMGGFHLKYLDDDSEWVLLTCDADLEECIDICRSSMRQTIKLSLQVSNSHSRSSVGSNSQFLLFP